MVEEFFTSPLVWFMFALGVAGSLVACNDWMSRFFFAWGMVLAYFFFWGVAIWLIVVCAGILGASGPNVDRGAVWIGGLSMLALYTLQVYCMRGKLIGASAPKPRNTTANNPFRKPLG